MKQCWQTWYYAGVVLVAGVTGTAGGHMSCPALAVAAGLTVPLLRSRPAPHTHWPPRATPTETAALARAVTAHHPAHRHGSLSLQLNIIFKTWIVGKKVFFTMPVADSLSYFYNYNHNSLKVLRLKQFIFLKYRNRKIKILDLAWFLMKIKHGFWS